MTAAPPVRLGPVLDEDLPQLFAWINDRETVLNSSSYAPVSEADHREWFDAIRRRKDVRIFSIREVDGGRLVGTCQLLAMSPVNRSAELQIRIGGPRDRGQGYGTAAVRQLLDHAFDDLNLERVGLHVLAPNEAARRLYLTAGFHEEGRLRRAAFVDGRFVDIILMGVLRDERPAT